MKDELWMRTWAEGHPRFSDDLHYGLLWLVARFRRIGVRIARPARVAETMPLPVTQRDAT